MTGIKLQENKSVLAYHAWVKIGWPVTPKGYPKMNLKNAKSIIKVLLPIIDIKGELKMKDFGTVGVCLKWLGAVARGMTWDEHMKEYMNKLWEERACAGLDLDVTAPSLFQLGGV